MSPMEKMRHYMNGYPVPNWVRVGAFWIMLAWIAATQYFGYRATQKAVQDALADRQSTLERRFNEKAERDSTNDIEIRGELADLKGKLGLLELRIDYRFQQTKNVIEDNIQPRKK